MKIYVVMRMWYTSCEPVGAYRSKVKAERSAKRRSRRDKQHSYEVETVKLS